MSKPLKPEQVAAAMRFYEITFAPIRKPPASLDGERAPAPGDLPQPPSNPQPEKDHP